MNKDIVASEPTDPPICNTACRFCNAPTLLKFQTIVLRNRVVKYFKCQACDSLQTEFPNWLELAYKENLAAIDIGAAQRTLRNLVISYFISKITKSKNILDIGGGDGLLCRLLRDYGRNAYVQDKYSKPIYAQNFTLPNFIKPDLILAYEVLEHFANPQKEIEELFNKRANFYLFSTSIYTNQGSDWWYLTPETGQHIFFYSQKALERIAKNFNYSLMIQSNLIFFYKTSEINFFQRLIIKLILNRWVSWILRSVIVILPTTGIRSDQSIKAVDIKPLSNQVAKHDN